MPVRGPRSTWRAQTVAAALLVCTGIAAPVAASAESTARPRTEVVYDCQHAKYEPEKYLLLYCDGSAGLKHLRYGHYSAQTATGHAVYSYDDCQPNCAAGHNHHYPVSFVMNRVRTSRGVRLFTQLVTDHNGRHQRFGLSELE
jgi:hypothetical protein